MDTPTTSPARIALIQAVWHRDITDPGREAFLAGLAERATVAVDSYEVPGSLEIPLKAQRLARTGRYSVIVALGFVVDGGIYRHEFVASAVIDGIMRVMLDTGVPILSVVLTPHHFHEHATHQQFFRDHFRSKGLEAAEACATTLRDLAAERV
jgi:6,7-dimethyl-8-ribityllumazine synthase